MTECDGGRDRTSSKRRQRVMFLVGLVVAAIPILCQLLMLVALAAAPDSFPASDRAFTEARFWPIQIVLLCVAAAGSGIVNCVRCLYHGHKIGGTAIAWFLLPLLLFFVESIMFSVTLLAAGIGWFWLTAMTGIGAFILVLAYALEMEIADAT